MNLRNVVRSMAVVAASYAAPAQASGMLIVLPDFIEDIFDVAIRSPSQINFAKAFKNNTTPPSDKTLKTNLHSELRLFDPNKPLTCSDFSYKSWDDWWEIGKRDGEIFAFGIWNTPIHLVYRRWSTGIDGVIALPSTLNTKDVVSEGKITPHIANRLLQTRGGYQEPLLDWINEKSIKLSLLSECGEFKLFEIEVK